MTTEISEDAARREVIRACQEMNARGLNKGTAGNVSLRYGSGFLITPTGMPYDTLEPSDIVLIGPDCEHHGPRRASSEWRMHHDVLAARPDLSALIHTHSTHATAVAILGHDLPALHYSIAAAGGGDIRCAGYATFGTQELADNVVAALDGRRACLMAHHGLLIGHATPPKALALCATVEELARLYLLCLPVGPVPILSNEQIEEVSARYRSYGRQ